MMDLDLLFAYLIVLLFGAAVIAFVVGAGLPGLGLFLASLGLLVMTQ